MSSSPSSSGSSGTELPLNTFGGLHSAIVHVMKNAPVDVPSAVFHYTGAESLLNILEQRQLWVSDIEFLNDNQEVRFAIDQVREALQGKRDEWVFEGEPGLDTDRRWGSSQGLLEALDRRFPKDRPSQNVLELEPFVASFCSEGDLLSMWRGYAHGPGFSIEFDTTILLNAFSFEPQVEGLAGREHQELVDLNRSVEASFSNVQYGAPGALAIIQELMDGIEFREPTDSGGHADQLLDLLTRRFACIKHPAFAEEKEVRLLAFRAGDLSPQRRLRAANGYLVPFFPLAFPHEAIRSIRVGPAAHRERSRVALERRVAGTSRGEYSHVKIEVSDAPLLY